MSGLLKKIRSIDQDAADVLKREGFRTDQEIRSLTRQDLCELFPGKLKLRKRIYEQLQQRPVDELIRELKGFIPHDCLTAALTDDGVLIEYILMLKDMKMKMHDILDFVNSHIRFLEEMRENLPPKDSSSSTAATDGQSQREQEGSESPFMEISPSDYAEAYDAIALQSQGTGANAADATTAGAASGAAAAAGVAGASGAGAGQNATRRKGQHSQAVIYKAVVSGKTFSADSQLMEKVKVQLPPGVRLIESTVDHKVIVLFCPISSRIDSDITAAMHDVKDDKPIILVLMHHVREAKKATSVRTWALREQIIHHVNVFYHETVHGLLASSQNNNAAYEIAKTLLGFSEGSRLII